MGFQSVYKQQGRTFIVSCHTWWDTWFKLYLTIQRNTRTHTHTRRSTSHTHTRESTSHTHNNRHAPPSILSPMQALSFHFPPHITSYSLCTVWCNRLMALPPSIVPEYSRLLVFSLPNREGRLGHRLWVKRTCLGRQTMFHE